MDLLLKNKVALVAGAGGGLGEAIAVALAEQGASLALADMERVDTAQIPMDRLAEPDEIGRLATFLASKRAANMTGASF
jgi:NAD(P)-dependent dehydrogenase (short-subunit alcohol dehydrogenase family)